MQNAVKSCARLLNIFFLFFSCNHARWLAMVRHYEYNEGAHWWWRLFVVSALKLIQQLVIFGLNCSLAQQLASYSKFFSLMGKKCLNSKEKRIFLLELPWYVVKVCIYCRHWARFSNKLFIRTRKEKSNWDYFWIKTYLLISPMKHIRG